MNYSKKEVYESDIRPLIKKILLLCEHNKIPMFLTFATGNNSQGTEYISEMLSAGALEMVLTDDKLAKHALVVNGFDVVPKMTLPEFEETLMNGEDD